MATRTLADVLPFTRTYKRSRPSRAKAAKLCPVVQLHPTPNPASISPHLKRVADVLLEIHLESGKTRQQAEEATTKSMAVIHRCMAQFRRTGKLS
jgi:hypothetical protein